MPDLRKEYAVGKSPTGWGIAQGLTVSPNAPFGWNNFTTHLTIEKWDTAPDRSRRVNTFHLSFKEWKKEPLRPQPGCTWTWRPALSQFQFVKWFEVRALYLDSPADRVLIATKVNEFVRKYVPQLLLDAQMWAAMQDAPTAPVA